MEASSSKNHPLTVKVLSVGADTPMPILACFPQNIPEKKDETEFEMLRKRKTSTLRSTNSEIPMIGKHKAGFDAVKYLVGYIDEEKQRLSVFEPQYLFPIHRHLQNDKSSELVGLNTNSEGLAHREMIVQEIGTKKGKKILQQMKNKVIKEDAIFSAPEIKELITQRAEVIEQENELTQTAYFQKELERKKEFLPEFNISAKSVGKIYNFDAFVRQVELPSNFGGLLDNDKFLNQYTRTLKDSITWASMTPEQSTLKKNVLCYLNCLLTFYRMRKLDMPLQEISSAQKIPFAVAQHIIDEFYEAIKKENGGEGTSVAFSRSKKQDTKLTCYILILALMVQGFKCDLSPLMAVLRLDEERISVLAKEVGCTVTKKSDALIAKLKKLSIPTTDPYQKKSQA